MRRWSLILLSAGLLGAGLPHRALGQAKPAAPAVDPNLPKQTQATQLSIKAEELQAQGKFAEAAALLQQASELTPDDWLLWDKTGWAWLDAAKAESALAAFQNAKKAAPAGSRISGGAIIASYALGNAKEVTDLVRQFAPADVAEAATPIIAKGLGAKPRTPDWSFGLGYLYARVLGNSPRGVAPLEDVVKNDPKRAEAWLLLVGLNRELDRGPQEDAAAVKYLELAPETPDAYRLRAERFAAIQKYGEAIGEYQAGITKYPANPDLTFQLGRLQERLGGVKEAEATYRKLITAADQAKLPAVRAQGQMQLAAFLARQRNYVEAERIYREATRNPAATSAVWTNWGSMLALTGKWPEAAAALDTAASRDSAAGSSATTDEVLIERYHAAVCQLAAGQKDRAKAGLLAAVSPAASTRSAPQVEAAAFLAWIDPQNTSGPKLAYATGDERWASFTWRRQPEKDELDQGEVQVFGRFSPADTAWRAILQQVQKTQPTCWPASYALARIYAAGGFSDDALQLLSKAATTKADWWALYYPQGQYYARQRDQGRGIPALQRVLQLAPQCRQARAYLTLLRSAPPPAEDDGGQQ